MKKIIPIIFGLCILFLSACSPIKEEISNTDKIIETGCTKDSDCILFGKTGECNCGCYEKNSLPKESGGECFCQAPKSCKCIEGICQGIFE